MNLSNTNKEFKKFIINFIKAKENNSLNKDYISLVLCCQDKIVIIPII